MATNGTREPTEPAVRWADMVDVEEAPPVDTTMDPSNAHIPLYHNGVLIGYAFGYHEAWAICAAANLSIGRAAYGLGEKGRRAEIIRPMEAR